MVLGGLKTVAVPDPLPPLAVVSKTIVTLRSPLAWVIVPSHPLMLGVPVPLAINTPLQKNWKSPVVGLNNTKLPVLVSSCRHIGNVVTENVHCVILPAVSVAVQVTVVVPAGKIEPDGGLQATVAPGQLSLTVGLAKVTTLPVANGQDAAPVAVTSDGQLIVGGMGSTVVVAVPVLLPGAGSGNELAAVAVLLIIVPCITPELTLTTISNVAVSPFATDALANTMLPVPPPDTESVRLQPVPLVTEADTNVVFAGTASVTVTLGADPGPL